LKRGGVKSHNGSFALDIALLSDCGHYRSPGQTKTTTTTTTTTTTNNNFNAPPNSQNTGRSRCVRGKEDSDEKCK